MSTRLFKNLSEIPAHLLRPRAVGYLPIEQPKPSKYRNQRTTVDGKKFDSKLEARCYQELVLRWKAGDVLWFCRQVNFDLPGGVTYRADFVAVCKDGIVVIDAKGVLTEVCKLKLKQMKAVHGIDVQLWTDKT